MVENNTPPIDWMKVSKAFSDINKKRDFNNSIYADFKLQGKIFEPTKMEFIAQFGIHHNF